jgi:hypothetical protein
MINDKNWNAGINALNALVDSLDTQAASEREARREYREREKQRRYKRRERLERAEEKRREESIHCRRPSSHARECDGSCDGVEA